MDEQLQPPMPDMSVARSKKLPLVIPIILLAGIAGYFTSAKFLDLWPFEISVPITTFTPRSTSPNQMENWETYQNKELKIEFKYPENWTILDFNFYGFDEGIAIRSLNSNTEAYPFAISILIKSDNYKNSREAFETEIRPSLRKDMDHEIRDIKFNGYDAIYFTDLGIADTKNIVLVQGDHMIEISYISDQRDTVYIDQILSTFKLTK